MVIRSVGLAAAVASWQPATAAMIVVRLLDQLGRLAAAHKNAYRASQRRRNEEEVRVSLTPSAASGVSFSQEANGKLPPVIGKPARAFVLECLKALLSAWPMLTKNRDATAGKEVEALAESKIVGAAGPSTGAAAAAAAAVAAVAARAAAAAQEALVPDRTKTGSGVNDPSAAAVHKPNTSESKLSPPSPPDAPRPHWSSSGWHPLTLSELAETALAEGIAKAPQTSLLQRMEEIDRLYLDLSLGPGLLAATFEIESRACSSLSAAELASLAQQMDLIGCSEVAWEFGLRALTTGRLSAQGFDDIIVRVFAGRGRTSVSMRFASVMAVVKSIAMKSKKATRPPAVREMSRSSSFSNPFSRHENGKSDGRKVINEANDRSDVKHTSSAASNQILKAPMPLRSAISAKSSLLQTDKKSNDKGLLSGSKSSKKVELVGRSLSSPSSSFISPSQIRVQTRNGVSTSSSIADFVDAMIRAPHHLRILEDFPWAFLLTLSFVRVNAGIRGGGESRSGPTGGSGDTWTNRENDVRALSALANWLAELSQEEKAETYLRFAKVEAIVDPERGVGWPVWVRIGRVVERRGKRFLTLLACLRRKAILCTYDKFDEDGSCDDVASLEAFDWAVEGILLDLPGERLNGRRLLEKIKPPEDEIADVLLTLAERMASHLYSRRFANMEESCAVIAQMLVVAEEKGPALDPSQLQRAVEVGRRVWGWAMPKMDQLRTLCESEAEAEEVMQNAVMAMWRSEGKKGANASFSWR
eukprot:TRINITY_DN7584_c0_g1_i1.p1 TRINITY_DN7584_c0_g1~~TRINITY_DN7584_c0_g1_i1.p1  ORF type:complete len:791 (-),score=136.35 TRINITY_DN7584_c0_g1_i1:613-2883(-)